MVVKSIRDMYQQKDYTETLQTKEILLLKALGDADFAHGL